MESRIALIIIKYEYLVVDIMNEEDGIEKYRYFVDGVEVDEEMREVLAIIDVKRKTLCKYGWFERW